MTEVRIFVEGGGNSYQRDQLRQACSIFLRGPDQRSRLRGARMKITFWGSRSHAYDAFRLSARQNPRAVHLLLVDAEGPVSGTVRHHLAATDGWDLGGIGEEQCHLMVQVMESWFVADPESLAAFYGQGFAAGALPRTQNVEQIARETVASSLKSATRNTQKGEYHKTRHAPKILERLDAAKVRARAPHCERLFATIEQHLT